MIVLVDATTTSLTVSWSSFSNDTSNNSNVNQLFHGMKNILISERTSTCRRTKHINLKDPSGEGFSFRVRLAKGGSKDNEECWVSHPELFHLLSEQDVQRQMKPPIVSRSRKGAHMAIVKWDAYNKNNNKGSCSSPTTYELQMRENEGGVPWTTIAQSLKGSEIRKKNLTSIKGYEFRVRPTLPSSSSVAGVDKDNKVVIVPFSPPSKVIIVSWATVINNNKDPHSCPMCLQRINHDNNHSITLCCGTQVCESCFEGMATSPTCPMCHLEREEALGKGIEAAERGEAWAEYCVAGVLRRCTTDPERHEIAADYYRRAALQHHRLAQYRLGDMYLTGEGVTRSVKEGEKWLKRAKSQGLKIATMSLVGLYLEQENGQEAEKLLLPLLAEDEEWDWVQSRMGWVCMLRGDYDEAIGWFKRAVFQDAALCYMHSLANCYMKLNQYGLAKYWIKRLRKEADDEYEHIEKANRKRRELKISLLKCAVCETEMQDFPSLCSQCKAYSYCGRKCQAVHWQNGHKEECKEVRYLKKASGTNCDAKTVTKKSEECCCNL